MTHQPKSPTLQAWPFTNYVAYGCLAVGNTLVLTSMWALGVTGTYLGDYFGILMDEPVTGFPFNVSGAPMFEDPFTEMIYTKRDEERKSGKKSS
ncbi:MAG: hypothetical protein Q9159_002074 [Coniocarpon cinnabarinum]